MTSELPPTTPQPAPGPGPTARRAKGPLDRALAWLTSPKLAIAILVAVLACCLVGVTVVRGARAGELIFATLWFNGLLVLLALSSAAAFFSRIWKRKWSLVQAGMITFHLSFMALLGGVVYNSLFSFEGFLRLTEGETLPNGDPASYDSVVHGRFFSFDRLTGETTLVRMHTNYQVDGANKRAAYEIEVTEGGERIDKVIYITEYFDFHGVRYFCLKEGYSVLVVLSDKQGTEMYGTFVPLQSQRKPDGGYLYTTGTATEPGGFPFPPDRPWAELQLTLWPSYGDRTGQVLLQVRPPVPAAERQGMVPIGGQVDGGDYVLSPKELRYWVTMDVRYDPGLPVSLGGLCFGLIGMAMTLVGRIRQGGPKARAAS